MTHPGQNSESALDRLREELAQSRRELSASRARVADLERQVAGSRTDERFHTIFDALPGMACVLNRFGELELVNERVLVYFGRTLEELKAWALIDAVHPDDLEAVKAAWAHSVATGTPFDRAQRQRRADGVYRWQHSRAQPAYGADGSITAWYMLITDIDDLRKAKAVLRQNQAYLEEAQRLSRTGSFGWNVRTGALIWSAQTFRILGYDVGLTPTMDLVMARSHPDDVALVKGMIEQGSRELTDLDFQHRLQMPDGTIKFVQVVAHAVTDDTGAPEFIGAVMDVSDRMRTTASLERALGTLRSSEQFARDQAEALRRILDSLAHESSPDRIVEHVLRTITEQLHAHSSIVWSKDAVTGRLRFSFSFVTGKFHTEEDARQAFSFSPESATDLWPGVNIFSSGTPQIIADIREEPDFPWRADLLAQGVVTVLVVPMLVAGEVQGVVGIRFTAKRSFQPEEIQLAQTLANQAMLALQSCRISAQSRQTAVLAERNRLARDIHDTLAQGFTGVIVQLEAAAEATARGLARESRDHVERAMSLARESLKDARRSVRALRPQVLEQLDLAEALRGMVGSMTANTPVRSRFQVAGTPVALPVEWEDNFLHIGREVITNALRHAQPSRFEMTLAFDAAEVRLEIHDDGRGFDPHKRSDGFGLLGIQERAEQMGGRVMMRTSVGQGTATTVVVPLVRLNSVPKDEPS